MAFRTILPLLAGLATASKAAAASQGPCDIYAAGGTPCVAAFGTTRALYTSYSGPLYQIQRSSDGKTTEVSPLSSGGVADVSVQDSFCANTTCAIPIIYDQSGRRNHLFRAPPGGGSKGPTTSQYDDIAAAYGAPVLVNRKKVYGVFVHSTVGYRNDNTTDVAVKNDPEGLYAIFDGTHYNDRCCFDFGNAETTNRADDNGSMEAIYFGDSTEWGSGAGSGPWVMADMENGLFSGQSSRQNSGDPTITSRFTTAFLKGDSSNLWALRGGDETAMSLSTYYSGPRPDGYFPMDKQGAIVLGIGGDNGNLDQGTWYEGVLTAGYPSDDTEDAVQANIAQAGFKATSLANGPPLTIGSTITLKATTPGFTNRYLAHDGSKVETQVITSSSDTASKQAGSWIVREGLVESALGCVSLESADTSGSFIRHSGFVLYVNANDGSKGFSEDATFCPQQSFDSTGTNAMRSWSYPTRYFRHQNNIGYAAMEGGWESFDSANYFTEDASWVIGDTFQN